ncbi:uncharacterized mitochondrial protein AtMg00810-like [Solanum lycopersicum]|uniref:uncharacterized mitochondrial protein AtMg00810-like n=1 Tax=Solanum lycopersicum TaxID=4081 RepID=UPI003749A60B
MGNEFEMSMMGKLTLFLGLQIKQSSNGISICQEKYIKELLKKFIMFDSKPIDTPMGTNSKLVVEESDPLVNQTMYRGIIGSLLYMTASRPDIVYNVGICASFQACPRDSHLKAAKHILRYLKKTGDLVLFYPAGDTFDLVGFVDADFAGYQVDRMSTFGMTHFLGSSLIFWGTKKQNSVALSIAEAEYVAAAACCSQLLWIKQHLEDFGINIKAIPFMCDNTSAVKEQIVDIFTKVLSKDQFERNRLKLGILSGRTSLAKIWLEQLGNEDKTMLWYLVPVQSKMSDPSSTSKQMLTSLSEIEPIAFYSPSALESRSTAPSSSQKDTPDNPFNSIDLNSTSIPTGPGPCH